MILFEDIKYDKFFNPLSCRNKSIYYDCIKQLIEKSKQSDLLTEFEAKEALTLYFRNCTYVVKDEAVSEDSDDSISAKKKPEDNAGAVLRYFRQCNWISERELAPNGDNLATVNPYCRRLIGAVERMFNRDNQAVLTNQIFNIYDTLFSALNSDSGRAIRPYSNILVPVVEAVEDLKTELLGLSDSIQGMAQLVLNIKEAQQIGHIFLKDDIVQKFFKDYFFIKKDGMIPSYISRIENMLYSIKDTDLYERMIGEYENLYNVSNLQAHEIINNQLNMVRKFITYEYVNMIDAIDHRINDYYNLYTTRILMVISDDIDLPSYINKILLMLKEVPDEYRLNILEKLGATFDLQSYKCIGNRSIELKRKRKPNKKTGAIVKGNLTKEKLEQLTKEVLHQQPDIYGVEGTTEYFNDRFKSCDEIRPSDKTIQSQHDALMMAAGIIYSGSSEFPYEVEFLGGTVKTEIATISNVRIKRKTL